MAASPHLSRKIQGALGSEAGGELIGILDRAANDISEVRGDLGELRHQMDVGFTRVDARFEAMGRQLEHELRKQTEGWPRYLLAIAVAARR